MSNADKMHASAYRDLMRDLWDKAWSYGGIWDSRYRPKPEDFYVYMRAFREHVDMLERRVEELEKLLAEEDESEPR